jgi:hypothetical protein
MVEVKAVREKLGELEPTRTTALRVDFVEVVVLGCLRIAAAAHATSHLQSAAF